MMRPIRRLLYFLSISVFITACNKDEIDAFYGRPKDLAPPIYDQLKASGLTSMVAIIEKAGYKDILGKAGYWTLFAPSNEAFDKFLQSRGLSRLEDIDKETALKIVRYNTLYSAYTIENISDFEGAEGGIAKGESFRKRTTYYDFVYEQNGRKYLGTNSNSGWVEIDNNYKYLPFFSQEFFNATGVTIQDYNTFFPSIALSKLNVEDASVKRTDIIAENGVIHELDKVLLPGQNLERFLSQKSEYSDFYALMEENALYGTYYKLQERYKALSGATDSVFVKYYQNLPFAPNNENFEITMGPDAQANFWSLAIPTNDKFRAYKTELLKNWGSDFSPSMKLYILKAHMWKDALWPSKLAVTRNSGEEPPTFRQSDIVEKKMLSNGIFYGINNVQEANVFRTVYSKPYLNKNYIMQTRGFEGSTFRRITDPTRKFGLIMQSDVQLNAIGYNYDEVAGYSWKNLTTGATANDGVSRPRFMRIINMSLFDNSIENLSDLSGSGVLKGTVGDGDSEDYLYYENNKIYASGNIDNNTPVLITKVEQTINGPVFYTTGNLLFSEKTVGARIKELATADPNSYQFYYDFLRFSSIGEALTGNVLSAEYTFLIPTNQAIREAVIRGELPGNMVTGAPDLNPASAVEKFRVEKFLQYHMIDKEIIAPDGDPLKQGKMVTRWKDVDSVDPSTFVFITSSKGSMQIRDKKDKVANLILAASNKLGDRVLIHSIDRVLQER